MKILILYVQRRLHGQINFIVFHFFYSKHSNEEELNPDFDEQRKIAEGADALLNLAGVNTALNHSRTHHVTQGINTASKSEVIAKPKKRSYV